MAINSWKEQALPAHSKKSAFTLIELLVVIAIIAILAALLLPTLNKANATARSAAGNNNQRQLQLAWQRYADDHSGRLVPNWVTFDGSDYRTSSGTSNSWISGSAMTDDSTAGICQGALCSYTRNTSIYRCPSDRTLWRYDDRRAQRPFNVALNLTANGGINGSTGRALDPLIVLKASGIRRHASMFTFVDAAERSMVSGTFVRKAGQTAEWFTIPGERDRACGANFAFADGHVEFHKWQFLGRIRINLATPWQNQADRADLIWVLSRVPDANGQ